MKFFEENPDKGQFIHWPLYGITEIVPANERLRTVGKVSIDLLYPTVLLLRTLTKIDVNKVSQHNKTIYKEVKKLIRCFNRALGIRAAPRRKFFMFTVMQAVTEPVNLLQRTV